MRRIPLRHHLALRRNVRWNLEPQIGQAGLSALLLPGLKEIGIDKGMTWDLKFTAGDLEALVAHGAVPAPAAPPLPRPWPAPPPPVRRRPVSC